MNRDEIKAILSAACPEDRGWAMSGFGYDHKNRLSVPTYCGVEKGRWRVEVKATPDGHGTQGGGVAPFIVRVLRDRPNTARGDLVHEARGDDLQQLLAIAILTLPEDLRPELSKPEGITIEEQAQKVAAALRGKPKLLNHVLYALRLPNAAGPWEYNEAGALSPEGLAEWTRMAPNGRIIAEVFLPMSENGMVSYKTTGGRDQGPTTGHAKGVDGAKEAADRALHELGWTTA